MPSNLFGTTAMPITLEAQIASVEREIQMRVHVYPRRVADAKMSQAKADAELELMRAVLATLQEVDLAAKTEALAERRRLAIVGLLQHLDEQWGDQVIEGRIVLRVDADCVEEAQAAGSAKVRP